MKVYRLAVLPGDGIGPEIMTESVQTLTILADMHSGFRFDIQQFDWSTQRYLREGALMPADGLAILERGNFDCILLGPIGDPRVPDHITLWGLLLPIRQEFDQYVNLRPLRLLPGVRSRHHGRKKVTSATKSNSMQYNMVFWDDVFRDVAREYPDITHEQQLIDSLAARFVSQPESLDVVVASNLFGDILTDLGAAISGSLGLAPSANLNPERRYPSMFQAIHGSAPDIAGKGIANPIASIWSGQLMLDFLEEQEAATMLMRAIEETLASGLVRTPDLGGTATTRQVGEAIRAHLSRIAVSDK